jgi:hypothetical protein
VSDLSSLVDTPGAHSMPYFDPAFPDRTLLLHSACPRRHDPATPVLFVHHGVGRNGADYRDYWMKLVDKAGIVAISIEFRNSRFRNIFGTISAICTTTAAHRTRASNGRTASTSVCSRRCRTRG